MTRQKKKSLPVPHPTPLYPPLHPKDHAVLSFIQSHQLREGLPPTRQEIARGLNLPHLMAAQRCVERLRQHGLLHFEPQSKRGIQLSIPPVKPSELVELPLLGLVAAGRPIEALEPSAYQEMFQVPASLVRGSAPHFVLRVQGESMIEDHICDGDYVVIRQQADAENGEKVVAIIDGNATLKRFQRKHGRVELHPANSGMKPIVVGSHQHLRIAGVYAGLIRVQK